MNKAPYRLVIGTDKWIGNFERELIGYSIGYLDEENIETIDDEIEIFWSEAFNSYIPKDFTDIDFYDRTLLNSWKNGIYTFFEIEKAKEKDIDSFLYLDLREKLNGKWEKIIVDRIKKYFNNHICKYSTPKLLRLYIEDKNGMIVKDYLNEDNNTDIKFFTKMVPKTFINFKGEEFEENLLRISLEELIEAELDDMGERTVKSYEATSTSTMNKLCELGIAEKKYGSIMSTKYKAIDINETKKLLEKIYLMSCDFHERSKNYENN